MKSLTRSITALMASFIVALGIVFVTATPIFAQPSVVEGVEAARGTDQPEELLDVGGGNGDLFQTIVDMLLFIVGVLSVIMLIIGGLRYVLSGGKAASITAAKNTILYALIGLVVAFFAYAIIHFVINTITGGDGGGGTFVGGTDR